MSEKFPTIVCDCELDNGYIFKNYFGFSSLRGRPIITFTDNKVSAPNRTADDQIFGNITLHGDEINLVWDKNIAQSQRYLSLTYDASRIQSTFGRIRKKDQAKIMVAQVRSVQDPNNFAGPNSSNEFIIYVSCGTGGEGREGVRSIAATRTVPDNTVIRYPQPENMSMMVIPVKHFRQMVDSFTKCKKEYIKIRYYINNDEDVIRSIPGFKMQSDSGIFEKYGEIPDEDNMDTQLWVSNSFPQLNIDESKIVRHGSVQPMIEIEEMPDPNEFSVATDKIPIFAKLASMHNEGNVRVQYQKGCHLKIAYRYGAFGEAEICLSNRHSQS